MRIPRGIVREDVVWGLAIAVTLPVALLVPLAVARAWVPPEERELAFTGAGMSRSWFLTIAASAWWLWTIVRAAVAYAELTRVNWLAVVVGLVVIPGLRRL